MTAKTPSQLILQFENGDIPFQSDYRDVFDSFVNAIQTTAQSIQSPLTISGNMVFTSAMVSGSNASFSGTVSAGSIAAGSITGSDITVSSATMNNFVQTVVSVAPLGTSQASASVVNFPITRIIDGSAGANSVRLASAALGSMRVIYNQGATNINVFPGVGSQIDLANANTAIIISASSASLTRTLFQVTTTRWITT